MSTIIIPLLPIVLILIIPRHIIHQPADFVAQAKWVVVVFLYNIIRTGAVDHIHNAVAVLVCEGDSGIAQNLSRTELCEVGMIFDSVFLAPVHGIAYLHIQIVVAPFGLVHRFHALAAHAYFAVFQSAYVIDELDAIAIGIANKAWQVEVIVDYVRYSLVRVAFRVAIGIVGVASRVRTWIEATYFLVCRGIVGDGGKAFGATGVGISQVVNLPVVATTGVVTIVLQSSNIASDIVGQVFIVAVGRGVGVRIIDVVVGRSAQAAQVIVSKTVRLPDAPCHLADVACFFFLETWQGLESLKTDAKNSLKY